MASAKNYLYQFLYSPEKKPVMLPGSVTQTSAVGVFATLVDNGITWLAVTMGSAGNSITVAIVSGGTAGAEVVTVVGNAISVKVESGVSTRTQVLTAVQASAAASALVSISVASGGTAASLLAATPLATGADTSFTTESKYSSLTQIGTGLYQLSFPGGYTKLLSCPIILQRSTAVDLVPQIKSVDLTNGLIVIRMLTGATPTNMASGDILYINPVFRNSSKW